MKRGLEKESYQKVSLTKVSSSFKHEVSSLSRLSLSLSPSLSLSLSLPLYLSRNKIVYFSPVSLSQFESSFRNLEMVNSHRSLTSNYFLCMETQKLVLEKPQLLSRTLWKVRHCD